VPEAIGVEKRDGWWCLLRADDASAEIMTVFEAVADALVIRPGRCPCSTPMTARVV